MSQKHHKKGSDFPSLQPDTLRLYSMLFCPYAQRTRMVLAHKKIPYENVNVNLMDKPEWFTDRNPFGLVPILERNDHIIYESVICGDYLDELVPKDPLVPLDPYEKAQQKMLMERFAKATPFFLGLLKSLISGDKAVQMEQLEKLQTSLQPFEDILKDKYFGGSKYDMLDIHMWPFIERFFPMELTLGQQILSSDNLPKLRQWVADMRQTEPVKSTQIDDESHNKFFISYFKGSPDYDMFLGA